MTWRTNALVLTLRHLGRITGFNAFVGRLVWRGYETNYEGRLAESIRAGDTVWDVGANVGYYVVQFAERVGPMGRVLAFEPSPSNFSKLTQACAGLANVHLHNIGLGDKPGRFPFAQGIDDLGATSRIMDGGAGSQFVEIGVADTLIDQGLDLPAVVKIDVEGYECEVLSGLSRHLCDPGVRLIGVEVHFGILRERQLGDGPRQIENLLSRSGFSVRWADASHLIAARLEPNEARTRR